MADIAGKSLIVKLSMDAGEGFRPVAHSTDRSAVAEDGWLIQSEQEQNHSIFRFDFLELMGGVLHCSISAAPGTGYDGSKVGVSRNGYLGFYRVAEVDDLWRVDLEGNLATPDTFEFVLRDYRGYPVGAKSEPAGAGRLVRYLNAEAKNTVRFRAHIVTYL